MIDRVAFAFNTIISLWMTKYNYFIYNSLLLIMEQL